MGLRGPQPGWKGTVNDGTLPPPDMRADKVAMWERYFLTCVMCGRHDHLDLTHSDARLIKEMRCRFCRSRMSLDPDVGRATLNVGGRAIYKNVPVHSMPESRL